MVSRDRYSRKLECSRCGHSGFAEASEKDEKGAPDVDFRIDEMPRGFRAERPSVNPAEFMIRCAQCGNIFRFCKRRLMRQAASLARVDSEILFARAI